MELKYAWNHQARVFDARQDITENFTAQDDEEFFYGCDLTSPEAARKHARDFIVDFLVEYMNDEDLFHVAYPDLDFDSQDPDDMELVDEIRAGIVERFVDQMVSHLGF